MQFKNLYHQTALRGLTVIDLQQMIEANGSRFVMREDGKFRLMFPGEADSSAKPAPDNMPPHEVIYGLSIVVFCESHQMAFDYFQFHKVCLEFLKNVRETIDEQTVQRLSSEFATQKLLSAVVAVIFRDAAGDEPQGLLQHAASTLLKHITDPASTGCTWAMRDLGRYPCWCPENIGKGIAASSNCRNAICGGRSPPRA